jgi:CheY-like chemotaxis protein/two-component sensor histidine kinase
LSPQPLQLGSYLADTSALFQTSVGEQINIKVVEAAASDVLMVDATALTTAILELLRNAAEAMPKGGNIVLTIGPADQHLLDSKHVETEGRRFLSISVRDTGNGMPEDVVENAVDPFFTTKNRPDGAGMGLSSVRGFARQSGGDIHIESAPEQGTCVSILLPALSDVGRSARREMKRLQTLDGAAILLVEDHVTVAQTLRTTLTAEGSDVVVATTAKEAQAILNSDSAPAFDLVLSDIRMPGRMDGIALARWLVKTDTATLVVLMSGFDEDRSPPPGVTVLQKPFTVTELKQVVTRFE